MVLWRGAWQVAQDGAFPVYGLKKSDEKNKGMQRVADLSGYAAADITFDYRRDGMIPANDIHLQVSPTGVGGPWTSVYVISGGPGGVTDATYQSSPAIDVSQFMSPTTAVRFYHLGANDFGSSRAVWLDDIEITGTVRTDATNPGGPPPTLATGYDLFAGESMTVTFEVTVDAPPSVTQVDNEASVTTDDEPTPESSGTITDVIVNRNPTAVDDGPSMLEDGTPITIDVVANDTDPDSQPVGIQSHDVVSANGGSISLDDNGTPFDTSDDTLVYTPPGDFNGSDTFDYVAEDDWTPAGTDTATVTVTITAVNDAPSFTKGADEVVLEDAGAQTVPGWASAISPGPANESAQTVSFSVTANTNPGLFSTAPAISPTGELTYTPAANANGVATGVPPNVNTSSSRTPVPVPLPKTRQHLARLQDFDISVTAVNDEPSFTKGADETVPEDAGTGRRRPRPSPAGPLPSVPVPPTSRPRRQLLGYRQHQPHPVLCRSGDLAHRRAHLYPRSGPKRRCRHHHRARDNGGTANGGDDTSPTQTFRITVTDVNDPPTAVDDPGPGGYTTLEDTLFTTGDVLSNDSDSDGVLDPATIVFDDTGTQGSVTNNANGTFDFDPDPDFNGTTTFDYRVKDDDGDWSNWATVTVTVTAVNDAPSFTKGADEVVLEDAGAQTVPGWASAISPGPANESAQTVSFSVTANTNPGLFSTAPAISPTGELTYTPAADANGVATITVELQDSGPGTAPDVNTSPTQDFDISVTAVNDAPSFTKGADETVPEGRRGPDRPRMGHCHQSRSRQRVGPDRQLLCYRQHQPRVVLGRSCDLTHRRAHLYPAPPLPNGVADITIELGRLGIGCSPPTVAMIPRPPRSSASP